MEEVILRFPLLGEKIFKILSNKSIIQSKMVSRSWNLFITNEKFYKQLIIYENLQKDLDENGYTPLHLAAENGNLEKCKLIVEHVENKNPRTNMDMGWTPLHLAVRNGHFDVCKLIIERVKDKNPAIKDGWTPLHDAGGHSILHRQERVGGW